MITLFSHQPAKKILPAIAALLLAALCVMGARAVAAKTLAEVEIPAGPLNQTLLAISAAFNVDILAPDELVAGRRALALSGRLSAAEALDQALQDSGLEARPEDGAYLIAASAEEAEEPELLPRLGVEGEAPAARFRHSDLPEAYEGGQVARGGRIGLLGNRDIFDTPFSVTHYTAELIENQQARTVADIIQNDPSARMMTSAQSALETISIRGFNIGGGGRALYDGLPDLTANHGRSTTGTLERVEVFKGLNALLNNNGGVGVGGMINLVPKRPLSTSLTRLSTDYDYRSRLGAQADISRRFGARQQFGARLNALYRNGESATENNKAELAQAALALEYRAESLKLETIVNYYDRTLSGADEQFYSVSAVPAPPDLGRAIQQPWEKSEDKRILALLKAEYKLGQDWSIHTAYGALDGENSWLRTFNLNLDARGNFEPRLLFYPGDRYKRYSWNAGIRGQFKTAGITHQLRMEIARAKQRQGRARNFIRRALNINSNLYNPVFISRPAFDDATGGFYQSSETHNASIALADTLGFMDERVLLTVGLRRQSIDAKRFNQNGVSTRNYDKAAITPAVGLLVKSWDTLSLYGNYTQALEQGPTAPNTALNAGEVFPPSVTEQLEFGMKFDLAGLGLTAGVFQIERPSGITQADRRFSVDGEQRNRGLELNAFGEFWPELRLLGGLTYIDSELTRTQDGRFDGKTTPGVPMLRAALYLEWDAPILPGLTLTARAEHMGGMFIRRDNSLKIPAHQLYDLGMRYQRAIGGKQFTLRMNVDNLLDKHYWTTSVGADNFLAVGTPRRFVMSFTMDF